ncbi:MAG: SH3 domain-containing protein [Anaerolineales bacterium]|nr:SH3 domain-containing protein [Anaerolineales bacterium]
MDTIPTRPAREKKPEPSSSAPASASPEPAGGLRASLAWWVWPLGAGIGLAAVIAIWVLLFAAPLPSVPAQVIPPYFTVFPPPTYTPIPPTLTITPFYTATPALPTVMPGTIGVGAMVEVTEDGLRLRDAPSLTGKILSQATSHELFTVIEGPRQADGYTWWLLQGVYDKSRQGWAVENYLRPS